MTTSSIAQPIGVQRNESHMRLWAVVAIAAVVPALLMMGPVVAGQLATQMGMNASQIGLLFMSENGAMSLATLPALYWLSRINLKKASLVFGTVFIAANLLSIWAATSDVLIGLRVLSGVAGGSLTVICIATAGTFAKPDRAYGFWVLGQLSLGAIGLTLLPRLFEVYGLGAFFMTLSILMALCLPLMRFLPERIQGKASKSASKASLWSLKPICGLAAVLFFYISLNGTWTFMGTLAGEVGINPQVSGDILAIATLFGIGGALIAAFMGGRRSYKIPLIIGYLVMVFSVLALLAEPDVLRYSLAAFAFKFTWTFVLPFILASLARLDSNGQIMNLSNLVIGGGLAIGPMLAGQIIETLSGVETFLYVAAALTITSLLLMLSLQKTKQEG